MDASIAILILVLFTFDNEPEITRILGQPRAPEHFVLNLLGCGRDTRVMTLPQREKHSLVR